MVRKTESNRTPRGRYRLERDKVGDLYGVIRDETGTSRLRISFRRNWYCPPYTDEGEVDYKRAARELQKDVTGGVLSVRTYLETGDLGYGADFAVRSKDELEHVLRLMRKVFVEGLDHDNAVRRTALKSCQQMISELQQTPRIHADRRCNTDRRLRQRRGRALLGRAWFRKNDRRVQRDRRTGQERRAA